MIATTAPLIAWLDGQIGTLHKKADRLAAEHSDDLRQRVADAWQAMIWYKLADLAEEHRMFVFANTVETVVFSMAKRVATQLVISSSPAEDHEIAWRQHVGLYYQQMFGVLKGTQP